MASRNQVNIQPPSMQPSREQITADFVASGQPIEQPGPNPLAEIAGGISEAGMGILKGIGDFINTQKETPEGRYLLTNMLAGITVGLGADPQVGANLVQAGQKQYQIGLQEQQQGIALEQKTAAEAKKAELASIEKLKEEERKARRDLATRGYKPTLTDDPNLSPDLIIEFTSPVSNEPIQFVNQTEATKRQVDVFQDGQKTKMYANSVEDARKIKDINESSEKIDRLTTSLIENRKKYTGGVLAPKLKAKMNQDITDLRLAYKKMAQLGVISESDVKNFIEKALPDPTRITLRQNIVESELQNFRQRALEDRDTAYEARVYNFQKPINPIIEQEKNESDIQFDTQGNVIVPENLPRLTTGARIIGVKDANI